MKKKVLIIGGGIAGMEASSYLTSLGYEIILLEKEDKLGGHLLNWEKLFPTLRPGREVVEFLEKGISGNVKIIYNAKVKTYKKQEPGFIVSLTNGEELQTDAILVTTGFDVFDARKKEEYGYGIYDNVITSVELEKMFAEGNIPRTASGKTPSRIGFVHCVGSRDEKAGNIHCSKVCCVTAVKQAVEIKERLPQAEVYCFYMDLRMYGRHFEELYKQSQEKWGVRYIRGRLSEACENQDGSVLVKVEDTLVGRPLKMSVDLLVLLVGSLPSKGTKELGKTLNINFDRDGFLKTADEHVRANDSNIRGIFLAGTCTGPMTIKNTIADARAAVLRIQTYLECMEVASR